MPPFLLASTEAGHAVASAPALPDLTAHPLGYAALAVFALAYGLVALEDRLHLKKSKPMLVAAGLIWFLVAWGAKQAGATPAVEGAISHDLLEFAELFLFLLAAMTFVNTLEERGVFDVLRARLVRLGWSYRRLFWLLGALAFVISPVADNLTTALILGAVALAVGRSRPAFVSLSCIGIVVAANAGGAFSPFGDITTLMVWQAGMVTFVEFFALFLPSLVTWLVPAACMAFAIAPGTPEPVDGEAASLKPGAWVVAGLFLATIALAVLCHGVLGLPPVLGMMTGLGVLKFYAYFLSRSRPPLVVDEPDDVFAAPVSAAEPRGFDPFEQMERAEWDTLMFFFGVILAVGGLGAMGYLAVVSQALYGGLSPTIANTLVGVLSAIIDNIPVMYAVLTMQPDMSHGQWLLVTLTAGVGGSLLAIGSAAGVALLGQARGLYTFMSHLKWTWAIALGYLAGIGVHLWLNRGLF